MYIYDSYEFYRENRYYYILSSIMTSLIVSYAIYVKVNFNYQKVNTKFKLLKFRFDIVNGYLIYKSLVFIITCSTVLLYNINPFQKQKFDLISIVFIIMAICLLMFVKITLISSNRDSRDGNV
jgi:hypothetical protein